LPEDLSRNRPVSKEEIALQGYFSLRG